MGLDDDDDGVCLFSKSHNTGRESGKLSCGVKRRYRDFLSLNFKVAKLDGASISWAAVVLPLLARELVLLALSLPGSLARIAPPHDMTESAQAAFF